MANIKKYSHSEILSFYSPCDPPQYFQSSCPIFTKESQPPVTLSNFNPNPNFSPRPFNFVPKKTKGSDSSNDGNQKTAQPPKVIDFRPQLLKEENQLKINNDNNENSDGKLNKYAFRPESIGKPISSSAPPITTSVPKQNNNQANNEKKIFDFKPQNFKPNIKQEETQNNTNEENKTELQNEKINANNNPSVFRPQKAENKFEPQRENNTQLNDQEIKNENKNQKELENKENKKTTPWANISVQSNSAQAQSKKSKDSEKVNPIQIQLQKEIDNSLISSTNNSSDEQLKPRVNKGFAPKKLDQAYEAPEVPIDNPSKPKQTRKTLTNFDEIEKEEINQKQNQQQQQPQQQQQKKGLFESLIEQEKQNQNSNFKKETAKDDDEAPKKSISQKVGFAPKQSAYVFEGPSIDELNNAKNSNNNKNKDNKKEVKSGFSALMEQEKISSEKEKKEKEKQKDNIVKKPSIVDILIAETIQEKSKEVPKNDEEEVPEEKPSIQAFNPIKASASYEAPSIEEIESFSKNQKKKTTFSEALSNQNQNKKSKPSFAELQKNEATKQAQTKTQDSFSNAPSFFDILVKEEKKEKQIAQSAKNNNNANKEEEKSTQKVTTGFNPKRNKPETGSFSEMLNKEKQKQKESQSKNSENNVPSTVKVNVRTGSKFTGNYPSFAQLINDEVRLEEQRSSPIPQINSNPMSGKNTSFQQKVEDEEYKMESTAIGDFVSVQGELPKKWINKKRGGRKRGGRGGNVRTDDNSDFFWGTPNMEDDEKDDDQNDKNNWPSVQDDDSSNFGFGKSRAPQKKDARISWLSKILEEELGEENPWEFAESLVNKTKPEMIRFLSTITFDQQQASNIANRFFQTFPAKK